MLKLSRARRVSKFGKRRLLEGLESRLLMSVSVFEYGAAASGIFSGSHTVQDSSGFIYSVASNGGLIKFDPVSGTDTFIDIPHETAPTPGTFLNFADPVLAADGNLWIVESFYDMNATQVSDLYTGHLIKVSTSGNVLASYNLGATHGLNVSPAFGPDGKLYWASYGITGLTPDGDNIYVNSIAEFDTGSALFTFHNVARDDANLTDLKITADGDIIASLTGHSFEPISNPGYQTDSSLVVMHNGTVIPVALDGVADPKSLLFTISIAPDGSLWLPLTFSGNPWGGTNQLVKAVFDSSFVPAYTSYQITGLAANDPVYPSSILAASDGNIYITESNGVNVDIFNTATETSTRIAWPSGNVAATVPQQYGNSIYFVVPAGNNYARIDLPVSGEGVSIAGFAGQSLADTVAILDTTLNSADILGLSATIYWGDSSSSAGTIVDNGNGTISVNGTHTYATDGDYITKIVVSGTTIDPVTVLGDATILAGSVFDAAGVPVQGHQEETTFSAIVASFVGPADTYTATINWGNGTTSNASIMLISGVYQVVGSVRYATQGNYNITVSITGTLNSAVVNTSVAIGDVPLVLTAVQPVVLAGKISQGPIAYFTDDTDGRKQNYDASINWGDGDTSKGTIQSLGAGSYVVMGNHNYKKKTTGAFTITTTVTTVAGEDAGASASVSVNVSV